MYKIRVNRFGLQFTFHSFENGHTRIELQNGTVNKHIIVAHPFEKLSQGWYNWMVKDMYIQDAFNFLTAGEREFLLTGLTPEEWDKMFAEDTAE